MPDRPLESYDRLLLALELLLAEAQRVGGPGVREWASLAMLDAIDLGEEFGMMWDDEAKRRRVRARNRLHLQLDSWGRPSGPRQPWRTIVMTR
jgi:hypothetical protein